jgi:hypothetical protein
MAAKLTRLTKKIAIQLHLVAESCTICSLAPGGRSGNFWIPLVCVCVKLSLCLIKHHITKTYGGVEV